MPSLPFDINGEAEVDLLANDAERLAILLGVRVVHLAELSSARRIAQPMMCV